MLSSDVFFTAITSKNDVTLCKLDVNVKNHTAVAGSVNFFQLFKEKSVRPTLKIKCGKPKGMKEKVSFMGIWCG